MTFANNDQRELAKTSLQEVYKSMKSNQQELREPQPKQSLKRSKSRIYKKSLFSDDESNDNMEFEENQIERYLVMAQIQNDQNPLKWWDVNKN
ncbi:unnamed protein product [Rhizophagus irregularis]|nr:unnamed protein product [Rhizophagus irregularis]